MMTERMMTSVSPYTPHLPLHGRMDGDASTARAVRVKGVGRRPKAQCVRTSRRQVVKASRVTRDCGVTDTFATFLTSQLAPHRSLSPPRWTRHP